MKRLTAVTASLLVAALSVFGCAQMSSMMDGGWTTLIDGDKGLENFNRIGDANWRAEGGAIVADKGKGGHLVTKKSYTNFQIRAEFYAETNTNSGIFIRASDPNKVGAANSYEVNIYDQRPGQEYATGGIVNFGRIPVPNPPSYKAAGKWNTFEITAKDTHLRVILNGIETVTIYDSKFASGPFTLQFGNHGKEPGGAIKWRKVQVKEL
jgi:Domain of Unknown Function (DUF1080)